MEELLSILIVMEMLAVNLFTVDICSHRKYSGVRTIVVLFIFTFILTAFTKNLWAGLGFNQGNALFAVIGIIYLLPLTSLYLESPLQVSGILFSAWIYTLLVYCISVRAAYAIPGHSFIGSIALFQGLLYVITIYPFTYWVKNGFLFVLQNAVKRSMYLLQAVSLCWFGTIIIINDILIYEENYLLKIIVIVAVSIDAVLSYWMIVSVFKSLKEVDTLQQIVYVDSLTGVYNRDKLFADVKLLIRQKKRFRVIFMDLNKFKSVNDKYGHQAGDRYLTAYAHLTRNFLNKNENLYRMSGDEFIIISQSPDTHELIDRLYHYPQMMGDIPFLGCSIGWADYPDENTEIDGLIALADQRMYREKHS